MRPEASETVASGLRSRGYAVVRGPLAREDFLALAAQFGEVVAEEKIALRPGAHAYVAKPGRVPFHTDQPQVEVVAWHCVRQDSHDGASLLVDGLAAVERLSEASRAVLRRTRLACPPVAGGPPRASVPVLRRDGERELLFCSPWLDAVGGGADEAHALRELWAQVVREAREGPVRVELAPGDALFVDNQRMLHGRDAIGDASERELHRLWVIRPEADA